MGNFERAYEHLRDGGVAYFTQPRGLIEVWGGEAVQFLNGLITNDVAALEDGEMMLAAFPNAKGRLLAVVRVKRRGEKYLFETEETTHATVFQTLYKFTFAGDFHADDVSESYRFVSVWNGEPPDTEGVEIFGRDYFVPVADFDSFISSLKDAAEISPSAYEVIRIEEGIPLYGKDMDDTTVVPETGIDGLIHYQKGCYIGQEVIARIHFLGKPAKLLKGLVFETKSANVEVVDLTGDEGKNAGRVTSTVFSPTLGKTIGLGYVRNAFADDGHVLHAGDIVCTVSDPPIVK